MPFAAVALLAGCDDTQHAGKDKGAPAATAPPRAPAPATAAPAGSVVPASTAGAHTAGAAPKVYDCGAKGQKPCPMQGG